MPGKSENCTRTHEPDLRELVSDIDGFRELMDERDRRYEERFHGQEVAIASALAAQEKLTSQAFSASREAILKAEESQKSYNQQHNDLSRKMEGQYREMIPRSEFTLSMTALNEKITSLSVSRGESVGAARAVSLGLVISGLLISLAMLATKFIGR